MDGSLTEKLGVAIALSLILGSECTVMDGASLTAVLGGAGGSWVFSNVSTCSVIWCPSQHIWLFPVVTWRWCALSRSSRALTYPRLGPLFRRTSSYAQSCPSLLQVLHRGLFPSHLSFLFLHIIHARRLGLGTSALFGGCAKAKLDSPLSFPLVCTVTVSPASSMSSMAASASGEVDMATMLRSDRPVGGDNGIHVDL